MLGMNKKNDYGLLLQSNGPNRDKVQTILCGYTGLDAAAVEEMMHAVPVMVLDNVPKGVAATAMRALDMAGAETVIIKHESRGRPPGGKKAKFRFNVFACLNYRLLTFKPAR